MDMAERLDQFLDWMASHSFFIGFFCGFALASILFVI
jgi:hypothetical protein